MTDGGAGGKGVGDGEEGGGGGFVGGGPVDGDEEVGVGGAAVEDREGCYTQSVRVLLEFDLAMAD